MQLSFTGHGGKMVLSPKNIDLLLKAAEGPLVCDTVEVRRLWYRGLVHWVSPIEVGLTSVGLAALYRAEEKGEVQ